MKASRRSSRQALVLIISLLTLVSLACSAIAISEDPRQTPLPAVTTTSPPTTEKVPQTEAPDDAPVPPLSLADAIRQNVAEIQILGTGTASGNSITVVARRTGDRPVTIRVDRGTVLVSSVGSEHNMVVRQLLGRRRSGDAYEPAEFITLDGPEGGEQRYAVEAYALDFHKNNPSPATSFSVGDPASDDVVAVLEAVEQQPDTVEEIAAVQAAIWAVTDDVTQEELVSRGYAADREQVRVILQAAGLDPACYALVGNGSMCGAADAPAVPSGNWQPLPDLPRHVNALIVDPQNPQVLYAGTGSSGSGSGVYKSEDAGLTWQKASSGLPSEDVRALAFSRTEPATLYATAGHRGDIYASIDGAASWTQLGNYDLSGFEAQLTVAPSDGSVLFVTEDVRGLYRSLDGGYSWTEVSEGLPQNENGTVNAQSVAIDPADANVIYVGTGWRASNANGVYKSTNGGETCAAANRGMIDYGITALAVNPVDPQVIYAGGANGELFKSTDGATTWTDLTGQLPFDDSFHQRVLDISIDPDNAGTLYLLHERAGVLLSTDGGATWRRLGSPPEPESPAFTAMAVLFGPQPVVVVGVQGEAGWRYAAD